MRREAGKLCRVEPKTCQEIWQPNLIAACNFGDPLRFWWTCSDPAQGLWWHRAQDITTLPNYALLCYLPTSSHLTPALCTGSSSVLCSKHRSSGHTPFARNEVDRYCDCQGLSAHTVPSIWNDHLLNDALRPGEEASSLSLGELGKKHPSSPYKVLGPGLSASVCELAS